MRIFDHSGQILKEEAGTWSETPKKHVADGHQAAEEKVKKGKLID